MTRNRFTNRTYLSDSRMTPHINKSRSELFRCDYCGEVLCGNGLCMKCGQFRR